MFSGTKAIRMVTKANQVSGGLLDSLATKHDEEFVAGSPENGLFNFTYKNGIRTPVLIWSYNRTCFMSGFTEGCWFPPNAGRGFTVMLGRMINRLRRIKGHGRRKDNA